MKRMEIGYPEGILPHAYEVCQTKIMWLSLCYTYLSGISNKVTILLREKRGQEEQTLPLSRVSALSHHYELSYYYWRDLGTKKQLA